MGADKHERERRKPTRKDASGYETVWVDLAEEDIAQIKKLYAAEPVEPLIWLAEAVDAEWKLSFNWSDHYRAYILAATCNDVEHPCYKRVFLVRHSDFWKALTTLAYVWGARIDPTGGYLPPDTYKDAW